MSILEGVMAIITVLAIGVLLWWLLITTEGVYLGRRVVILLYDLYARRYEKVKGFQPEIERFYLARPLMQSIAPNNAPLVLDVATGTARLPRALYKQSTFHGVVIGIDLSRRMLRIGAGRVVEGMHYERVHLMHGPAEKLPFPDNTFDVVTCLESLEFMSNPRRVITEIIRVTRPGGQLLLTNRRGADTKLMPGKTWSRERATEVYRDEFQLEAVRVVPWQDIYDYVWARKPGTSPATRARPLGEIWQCPRCNQLEMQLQSSEWVCANCQLCFPIGADGVIEQPERYR